MLCVTSAQLKDITKFLFFNFYLNVSHLNVYSLLFSFFFFPPSSSFNIMQLNVRLPQFNLPALGLNNNCASSPDKCLIGAVCDGPSGSICSKSQLLTDR